MSVDPLPYGGCPWPVDASCVPADWGELPAEVRSYATALASQVLTSLTAGRVGGCPITVRPSRSNPCLPAYEAFMTSPWMRPGIDARGLWINSCDRAGSVSACEVALPAPVGRVDAVKVDGVAQPLADYRLDEGNVLVYQGAGPCPFPAYQDLALPDTAAGTWSVTYLNAMVPDGLAARVVTALAYEFALACSGEKKKCRLPANVATIVRTGVTMTMTNKMFPEGRTGLPEVDAWVSSINPRGRRQQTRVYSPDAPGPRIQGPTLGAASTPGGLLP